MKWYLVAILAGVCLLVWGTGTALANPPVAGQEAGQAAASDQSAGAGAGSIQGGPENAAYAVRVLSPGSGGDVTQSNTSLGAALAANANATSQTATQAQSGGGTQAAGQAAQSDQDADVHAQSVQVAPTNENISVRVLSPGKDGDVTQSNTSAALAGAVNANETTQGTEQTQSGGCDCKAGGTQAAVQSAKSDQDADAHASSLQVKPKNQNIAVRVLSPGDDGDVRQSNTSAAIGGALNANKTTQGVGQSQSGGGTQAAAQTAKSDQDAKAKAASAQLGPTNRNVAVRVLSPGHGGDVTQSNTSLAAAVAANANETDQQAAQRQSGDCGCKDGGTQAAAQEAKNDQSAKAEAASVQLGASNLNAPVRVLSPGSDGDVEQSNTSAALAGAINLNRTGQTVGQAAGSGGTQAAAQSAKNDQDADAHALSLQADPSNANTPVAVGGGKEHDKGRGKDGKDEGHGKGGDVEQSNTSIAAGLALNANGLEQTIAQEQDACRCDPKRDSAFDPKHDPKHDASGVATQAAGQSARNDQDADAHAASLQVKPSNTNAPVSVLDGMGHGKDHQGRDKGRGDVEQSNTSVAAALALNANRLEQTIAQDQDACGCDPKRDSRFDPKHDPKHDASGVAVQAAGQSARNDQDADAKALSAQLGASNADLPVGGSGGGDVEQSNTSAALAGAVNLNRTAQAVVQEQDACACKHGTAIQAAGQLADGKQDADAHAASLQVKPSNTNAPLSASGGKGGGDVRQSNTSVALGVALNLDATAQGLTQRQAGGGIAIQAAGQAAGSKQDADAAAASLQLWPSNASTPVGLTGHGPKGDVSQSNTSLALAFGVNANGTTQAVDQTQRGCGCHGSALQVAEQAAWSKQDAVGKALSLQIGAWNLHAPVFLPGKDEGKEEKGKDKGRERGEHDRSGKGKDEERKEKEKREWGMDRGYDPRGMRP